MSESTPPAEPTPVVAPAPYTSSYAAAPFPIFGLISLVASGLGLLLAFPTLGFIAIFPVAGIVLGFIGLRKDRRLRGLAIAGVIVGFVALVICIVLGVALGISLATSLDDVTAP